MLDPIQNSCENFFFRTNIQLRIRNQVLNLKNIRMENGGSLIIGKYLTINLIVIKMSLNLIKAKQ